MVNKIAIVGCGTLGGSLAIHLIEQGLISFIELYDYDIVTSSTGVMYPYRKEECGISKVKILEFVCKKINSNVEVNAINEIVLQNINKQRFIIDARDRKLPKINYNIKMSIDGKLLYVDSRPLNCLRNEFHHYVFPKNIEYIKYAIHEITNYLIFDIYKKKDLRFYDLHAKTCHIINKE